NTGRTMDSEEAIKLIMRYEPYFCEKGGVTLSGGEPLMQPEFAAEVFELCRERGIHTALDTAGAPLTAEVMRVLDLTDLLLLDIKHTESHCYTEITGKPIDYMLGVFSYACEHNIDMWARQVVVPGMNDKPSDMLALAELLKDKPNLKRVELLAYHTMAVPKWEQLGIEYPLAGIAPLGEEQIEPLCDILRSCGLPVAS
ncbi:MAG: radical SAM protein, partial [Phycisphaerae bacterium]